jgi:hypothetical protein
MFLTLDIENYNKNQLHFFSPINNTIISNSIFTKILYKTMCCTMNGVYCIFPVENLIIDKNYNKCICHFKINQDIIEKINNIENDILLNYTSPFINLNKITCRKLNEKIKHNKFINFSFISNNYQKPSNNKIILKISGVWETEESYGITYKFILPNNIVNLG